MVRRLFATFALLGVVLFAAPAPAKILEPVKPMMDCAALARAVIAPAGEAPARIQTAGLIDGDGNIITDKGPAAYCDVKGYVAPSVKFELRLPMSVWTQRLLFTGCGGFCGNVRISVRAAEGCLPVTHGEFALVTSDLGHDSGANSGDSLWAAGNPQGVKDFGWRGVHVTTVAAKAIIAKFYGRAPTFSYFSGCSDGGREAMMEAERFPADYNGIVAGASVVNETFNNTIFHGWAAQHLTHADNSLVIDDVTMATLHAAANAACGAVDGTIPDPSRCQFDPGALLCVAGAAPPACLTAEQVAAARAAYSGALDDKGKPIYFGYPVGSELSWNRQAGTVAVTGVVAPGGFVSYLANDPPDPIASGKSVRFTTADVKKLNVFAADLNALDSNLAPFARAGGKLIMWQGFADASVPSMSSVDFYGRIRKAVGADVADKFVRLYMLPGVYHCGNGLGPDKIDALTAVMGWAEDGNAPGALIASKTGSDVTATIKSYTLQ